HSFTQLDSDQKLDIEQLISDALKMGKEMLPFLADVSIAVDNAIKANKRVLIEGAQGTLLDIDFGTYPFVTSSNSTSGGACTGVGVGPTKINEVIGIIKAYTTRVGMGPFPTELTDEAGENLQKIGKEFGATTGRPRRCGWFDTVVARYAARVNGVTSFALTKLDILDSLAEIPICIGYQYNDELLTEFPTDLHVLENCHPVYESMPGWQSDTTDLTEYEQLPQAAKNYIHKLETLCGIRFSIISVGPDRKNTLFLK
ncbi:adenylosuccinate synthetase, partial [bacterium]|nr:adenylosuccinate synthetase [bacterium]